MNAHPLRATIAMATILAALAGERAQAQGSRSNAPITPSSAHERLAVFEGTWIGTGSPTDRASRDSCTWLLGGRRHMICRRVSESASGIREQMMIYSYRRSDSTYTVTVLLSGGQVWSYAGRPDGDRWVLYLASTRPDGAQRLRQVITAVADTLHFVEQVSENGGPWRLTDASEDYKYVRARSTPP